MRPNLCAARRCYGLLSIRCPRSSGRALPGFENAFGRAGQRRSPGCPTRLRRCLSRWNPAAQSLLNQTGLGRTRALLRRVPGPSPPVRGPSPPVRVLAHPLLVQASLPEVQDPTRVARLPVRARPVRVPARVPRVLAPARIPPVLAHVLRVQVHVPRVPDRRASVHARRDQLRVHPVRDLSRVPVLPPAPGRRVRAQPRSAAGRPVRDRCRDWRWVPSPANRCDTQSSSSSAPNSGPNNRLDTTSGTARIVPAPGPRRRNQTVPHRRQQRLLRQRSLRVSSWTIINRKFYA